MKNKTEIMQMLNAILQELESGTVDDCGPLWTSLTARLETIVDILGDELPIEYYDRVNEFVF